MLCYYLQNCLAVNASLRLAAPFSHSFVSRSHTLSVLPQFTSYCKDVRYRERSSPCRCDCRASWHQVARAWFLEPGRGQAEESQRQRWSKAQS